MTEHHDAGKGHTKSLPTALAGSRSPLKPWPWPPRPPNCALQGINLVDFGAGEPHFPTPRHIKDAAIAAIDANFTRYTVVPGIPDVRKAIVERHACDFGSDYTSTRPSSPPAASWRSSTPSRSWWTTATR
jgi:hypothetical protein